MSTILKNYEIAKQAYAALGVDTDKQLEKLHQIPLSIHCWQCDDVAGFESFGGELTGGIQTTGNYPGKPRNPDELRMDLDKALSYIPGANKINIHASYLESGGRPVDRNAIEPRHFSSWADWAVAHKIGLDFNPTYFSHPLSADGATLSHADSAVREFWIEHGIRSRRIAQYLGSRTGIQCINNIWIPDGEKEFPIDTMGPRQRLKDSLDRILAEKLDESLHIDAVESKLFGIGSEAYVVGSHEFYMGYAVSRNDLLLTLDMGHFHPTETIVGKLSPMLLFLEKGLLLHVSRPVRWDSDHVVLFDDDTRNLMREIVRLDALDKVCIASDYFDASINRIIALAVGSRNTKKALLEALLQPLELLRTLERSGDVSGRLAVTEELKTLPLQAVWDYYCEKNGVLTGFDWIEDARTYEKKVLANRN